MRCPFGRKKKFEEAVKEQLGTIHDALVSQRRLILDSITEITKMTIEIEALQAKVTELIANVTAEGNAVAAATLAIQGMTDQMAVLTQALNDAIAAQDPVAIQAAADAIGAQNEAIIAQTAALAAAIPATPEP